LEARGVRDRVETVAGSFFKRVPEGCDAYLLKDVLHDWDDDRAAAILTACRRALRPGARVLVVETLLGENEADYVGCLADIHMMVVCDGGRQRSEAQFRRLFERAGLR